MTNTPFNEEPFFFRNDEGNYRLFGVEYLPQQPNNRAYIFLQPIATERNVADAIQVNLARRIASTGITVLRFDYYGTGDSDGSFSDVTLATMMSDVETCISRLRARRRDASLGLFGMRFGALLASLFAEKSPDAIDSLILCAPVTNGIEYIKQELMQAISHQSVIFKKVLMDRNVILENIIKNESTTVEGYDLANLNGFPLTRDFVLSLKDCNLLEVKKVFKNNCLIVCLDTEKKRFCKEAQRLAETYGISNMLEYAEVIDKDILWIHSTKYFSKSCPQLNDTVSRWIEKGHGKNS